MTTPTPAADPAGQPTPVPAPPKGTDPASTPPAGDPPKDQKDEPLGEGGKKALQAERARADELEKQIKALAPLQKLAEALGTTGDSATGPTDIEKITERLANHEKQLADANLARWRAEVANAKHLTPDQAAELKGSTAEELAAHADRLLALFPPAAPGTPRPDPSQGGKGGGSANLDAQIAEAQKAGNPRLVLSLQRQKLQNQPN